MMRRLSLLGLVLASAPLTAQVTPPDTARADTARADTARLDTARVDTTRRAVAPPADQARGVDAEIRVALFEMLADRQLPALHRLQWLESSPVALADAGAQAGALRGREDLLFLLSQSYYRLGMGEQFRASAGTLLGQQGNERYRALLQSQLLLDSYRRGDHEAVVRQAEAMTAGQPAGPERALAQLVIGLSAYQLRNFDAARSAFAAAQQQTASPGEAVTSQQVDVGMYGQFAQYMHALTLLRGDTTRSAEAFQALQTLAASARGEFADQVRLTAAMLAYESEQYAEAAQLAGQVSTGSGLAAQAQLTRAWALYKTNDLAGAAQAFREYAERYPLLPERAEARLMEAQALLQLGRTADAERIFRSVADSAAGDVAVLQARARGAMRDAAQALVSARAAGLLFISDPASGKTIALEDAAGVDWRVVAAAFAGELPVASTTVTAARPVEPDLVSLADVRARLESLGPTVAGDLPRRLVLAQAGPAANRADFAARSQALYSADVAVALARYALQRQMDANAAQLTMLRAMQERLTADEQGLGQLSERLRGVQDSLSRVMSVMEVAATRLRQILEGQINTARLIASENVAMIDSVRTSLAGGLAPRDAEVLRVEGETAARYREMAELVQAGLDGLIRRHPTFTLADSVRNRGERIAALLSETQSALASARSALEAEIARLAGPDPENLRPVRAQLAAATSAQQRTEEQLVALVDAELDARARELLASLQRDTEAAEFGSASALFFQALDAGRTAPAGVSGAAGAEVPALGDATRAQGTPAPPSKQQQK